MAAALPSLSQIPEETSLDGSRISSLAIRPKSIAGASISSESSAGSHRPVVSRGSSSESARATLNFSRPRTASPAGSYRAFTLPPLPDFKTEGNYILDPPASRTYGIPRYQDREDDLADDEKDIAPAPVVLRDKKALGEQRSQAWLYRPASRGMHSQRDSDASSFMTDTTDTDAESIAESTGTDYNTSISDFAYDVHNGWQPRHMMDKAARERQRWAAPMIVAPAQRAVSCDRPSARDYKPPTRAKSDSARSEKRRQLARERQEPRIPPIPSMPSARKRDDASWLDSGSEGTARTPRPGHPATRKSYIDVVEAASAHRYGTRPQAVRAMTAPGSAPGGTTPRVKEQERPLSYASTSSGHSDGWKASDVDISSLSAAKIAKLERKGINPALYLEMKKARKMGRRGVAMLNPNSFIG